MTSLGSSGSLCKVLYPTLALCLMFKLMAFMIEHQLVHKVGFLNGTFSVLNNETLFSYTGTYMATHKS